MLWRNHGDSKLVEFVRKMENEHTEVEVATTNNIVMESDDTGPRGTSRVGTSI